MLPVVSTMATIAESGHGVLLVRPLLMVMMVMVVCLTDRSMAADSPDNVERQVPELSTGKDDQPTDRERTIQYRVPASSKPNNSTHTSGDSILTPNPTSMVTPAPPSTAAKDYKPPQLHSQKPTTPASSTKLPGEKSGSATPEVVDRPLRIAAVLLFFVAVVTSVGLMHFKVCKEIRRVWRGRDVNRQATSTSSSMSWRCMQKLTFFANKLELALVGLYRRSDQMDKVQRSAGPLLNPVVDGVGDDDAEKSGVILDGQSYV